MAESLDPRFYERFWEDEQYSLDYAFDSAVRDRFPAIRRVWGHLEPPHRVLDFGCGNGVLTHWMFANGFGREVVGVDVSRTAIDFAQRTFQGPGLSFAVLDDLDRLDDLGTFDVAVASHVLEHVPDPDRVLQRLRGVARWVLAEVPLEDCAAVNLRARLSGRPRSDNPVGHIRFWNRDSFSTFVRDQGFVVVRDHRYASAPSSPYTPRPKRLIERVALRLLGLETYGRLLSTHYATLLWPARGRPDDGAAA